MTKGPPSQAGDAGGGAPVVVVRGLSHRYRKIQALGGVSLDLPAGAMVGLIGPDGVGKSSLLSLIAGARAVTRGEVTVLGGDMRSARHRAQVCPRIAYMPQGLGRNLYPTLSVRENIDFFGRLFGQGASERRARIATLLARTGMAAFADRPASKLSGGMKQKLGLCCALIHDPDLLILDEPTTGVDPLSRRQFWDLITDIRDERPGMSVIVATAYMEEAARFDWLVAMHGGQVLATGTPTDLLARTGTATLDDAFIALLPEADRAGHHRVTIPPHDFPEDEPPAIEAEGLSMRFDGFTAVDQVSFRIRRGEIFGFLGSNGCGKTTTMKMLTGLLEPSEGTARLFGKTVDARDMAVRRRVGFMSQSFSLYSELTVRQNLDLHARLFGMVPETIGPRIDRMASDFGLIPVLDTLPDALPLGIRQRLSLAVAMIHGPEILILDEPTSGVDPVARDHFWAILADLSRNEGVTIFVSTHFMNEAMLCDRISLMHAGKVLVSDTAENIIRSRGVATLDDAFVAYLQVAIDTGESPEDAGARPAPPSPPAHSFRAAPRSSFSLRRMASLSRLEAIQLYRDPIRAALALMGSLILMFVLGYGINMDVEDLSFAVLDRDQTTLSRDYALDIEGSRYFIGQAPLTGYDDIDARMRAGTLALAIEIPPGFARDVARGKPVEVGAWIDGANPQRAEIVQGYVQGMHATWLARQARRLYGDAATMAPFTLETRYRYNPNVKSLVSMVPAVIPLLLMMIPAMLTALSVVREKELGSIVNLYVTPTRRAEFLIGKQLPYLALAIVNYLTMLYAAVFLFGVPFTGSLLTMTAGAILYATIATGMGLMISSFISSQIAAIFGTTLLTLMPALQYGGMTDPVSTLQGAARIIGNVYPTSHFMAITRGTFSKGLGFSDLSASFLPLLIAVPVTLALGILLLKKQAR